jgi:hypothetical protein
MGCNHTRRKQQQDDHKPHLLPHIVPISLFLKVEYVEEIGVKQEARLAVVPQCWRISDSIVLFSSP